jgi:predicted nucleic acid-binding Zn ribbon protein
MDWDRDKRQGRHARSLGEVLGDLFVARGLGRTRAVGELETGWEKAAGPEVARCSRVTGIKHGVLCVTVTHSALLEELAAFRKPVLLDALRLELPNLKVRDVRFRVGVLEADPAKSQASGREASSNEPAARVSPWPSGIFQEQLDDSKPTTDGLKTRSESRF